MIFRDRKEAGRLLGQELARARGSDVADMILGIPRGGVVVAQEVASALDLPLDVMIARKIGAPFNPELAIGAVTSGGLVMWNEHLVSQLAIGGEPMENMAELARKEVMERVRRYRSGRNAPSLRDRRVVLVDDGIATGFTVQAALRSTRDCGASEVILAVPVAPQEALDDLRPLVDEICCLHAASQFWSVGYFYELFGQVSDAEVIEILECRR